eukprot:PLAT10981.1.p2 GENE.PLAT10981.1~~PLAT10981.1.p2  ORF type:complete len:257 (+),score=105.20 PLAT10981.1:39-773(+)
MKLALALLVVCAAVVSAQVLPDPFANRTRNLVKRLDEPGDDPADSWLAYAVAKGAGKKVTLVNATWTVPELPTQSYGSNAPGFWFGIEPEPADLLLQPILAYGYTGPDFVIFNGRFAWTNGSWWHSETYTVKPGQTVQSYIKWHESQNSYELGIGCVETGKWIVNFLEVENPVTYTDVYFVVEHQPQTCAAYPANGNVVFRDIAVEWEGKPSTPSWKGYKYKDDCDCTPDVVSSSELKFTWQTS